MKRAKTKPRVNRALLKNHPEYCRRLEASPGRKRVNELTRARSARNIRAAARLGFRTVEIRPHSTHSVAKYKFVQGPAVVSVDKTLLDRHVDSFLPDKDQLFLARDMLVASFRHAAIDAHTLNEKWYINPVTGQKMKPNDGLIAIKLLLIVSEIAEAFEAFRKDAKDDKLRRYKGLHVELNDAGIRLFDLLGFLGVDVEGITRAKVNYNLKRKDHKLKARLAKGGKRF